MVSTALTRARRSQAALALDPIPASKVQSVQQNLQNLTSTTQQTRHVASEPSPEARANVQAVPQGNVWRRHGISNEYYWESSGMGSSSLLCMGEDNSGCGCVGKRSSRRPRCFEQRHERKEA